MRRIRKWLLAAAIAALLLMPLASVASADPGDGAVPTLSSTKHSWSTTSTDPGDGTVP